MSPWTKHFIIPMIGLVAFIGSLELGKHASRETREIVVVVCVLLMPAMIIVLRTYGFLRRLLKRR